MSAVVISLNTANSGGDSKLDYRVDGTATGLVLVLVLLVLLVLLDARADLRALRRPAQKGALPVHPLSQGSSSTSA